MLGCMRGATQQQEPSWVPYAVFSPILSYRMLSCWQHGLLYIIFLSCLQAALVKE